VPTGTQPPAHDGHVGQPQVLAFVGPGEDGMLGLAGPQPGLLADQPARDLPPGPWRPPPGATGVVPDALTMALGTALHRAPPTAVRQALRAHTACRTAPGRGWLRPKAVSPCCQIGCPVTWAIAALPSRASPSPAAAGQSNEEAFLWHAADTTTRLNGPAAPALGHCHPTWAA
jgi:hypothetical protein